MEKSITLFVHKNSDFSFMKEWDFLNHTVAICFNGICIEFNRFNYSPIKIDEDEWIILQ